jgi:hypothetical protein
MNPIKNMFGNSTYSGNVVLLQAIGAMMRGENPQDFLKNLAETNPKLKGIDFTNLQSSAEKLYADNGKDINTEAAKIQQFIGNNSRPGL